MCYKQAKLKKKYSVTWLTEPKTKNELAAQQRHGYSCHQAPFFPQACTLSTSLTDGITSKGDGAGGARPIFLMMPLNTGQQEEAAAKAGTDNKSILENVDKMGGSQDLSDNPPYTVVHHTGHG